MRVLSVNLGLPREAIWRGKRSRSGSTRSRSPDFGPGTFGENLTTEGLLDGDVSVGDRFRVGTAELVVTQPRLPCFKLGIRWATTSS
jgi:MOSC domain-containing protein YiiM